MAAFRICLLIPLFAAAGLASVAARTSNGNDFALYFSEAEDAAARKRLLDEARDRPHFFRYLQIMKIEDADVDGRPGVRITAFEPASLLDVRFTVTRPVSLSVLRKDPVTKIGSAIAVTAKVRAADVEKNVIDLGDAIVRHKDRLNPKIGKELLCEVEPGAVFYNYTAGSRPVTLTYQDRDLIRHKERVVADQGPDGWVAFLENEIARREKQRKLSKPPRAIPTK